MMKLNCKQKAVLADVAIALGILILAFLLKDADAQSKTQGIVTVMVAVFIRVGGARFLGRGCKNSSQSN